MQPYKLSVAGVRSRILAKILRLRPVLLQATVKYLFFAARIKMPEFHSNFRIYSQAEWANSGQWSTAAAQDTEADTGN